MTPLKPPIFYGNLDSPIGQLHIFSDKENLKGLFFDCYFRSMPLENLLKEILRNSYEKALTEFEDLKVETRLNHPLIRRAKSQLTEYFSRHRTKFDLPLAPEGSLFQRKAWKALLKIPYGNTVSYQEQAHHLGGPHKARAAGGANSKNPISIVVPCHRVIAKNGALSGFGGGVSRKQFLLDLEKS